MLVGVHPVGFLDDWVFGDFQSLKPNLDEHRIQPIEASHLAPPAGAPGALARATLQRRLPWPTDLAVRDGTTMLIVDTHPLINGLAANYQGLGFRPGMLVSSLGRCHLAFCPDDERCALVAKLADSTRALDRLVQP